MKNKEQIIGTAEAWENGELGRNATHAVPAPAELTQQIDDALGLQMISIRLPKELIEEYKMLAQFHKLGYQPLMRDALKRFAVSEVKKIAVQYANEKDANEKAAKERAKLKSGSVANDQTTALVESRPSRTKHREKEAA